MKLADAETNLVELVERVYSEGISIDLERDSKIIARLTPGRPRSRPSRSPSSTRF